MNKTLYRIVYASWIFSALTGAIALLIGFTNEKIFIWIGTQLLLLHFFCFLVVLKVKKNPGYW